MKRALLLLALVLTFCVTQSQQLSKRFNPIIKEDAYEVKLLPTADGNYLVYGSLNYFNGGVSGSLMKADSAGNEVTSFQKVFTNKAISNVVELAFRKLLILGEFEYVNGLKSKNLVLLNFDGTVNSDFSCAIENVTRIAVQPDGKIIVVEDHKKIYRINQSGSIDNSFPVYVAVNYINVLEVGPDGKIYFTDAYNPIRLNADGSTDTAYTIQDEKDDYYMILRFQSDGKAIVAVNRILIPYQQLTLLRRIDSNGSFDTTFHEEVLQNGGAINMIIRKNGKIVLTGNSLTISGNYGNAIELNADGTFSKVLISGSYNFVWPVSEDLKQRLLLSGKFSDASKVINKHVIRFNSDNSLDRSFNMDVASTITSSIYSKMAVQKDGKLIIGGGFNFKGVNNDSLQVVRLMPDGSTDDSFSVLKAPMKPKGSILAITSQYDEKTLVGGSAVFNTQSPTLARLLPDGSIDGSFQIGAGPGLLNSDFPQVRLIKIFDSKIYIAGNFDVFNGNPCKSLAILDMNGNFIGPSIHGMPPSPYFQDMAMQSNGKIVFLGTFNINGTSKSLIRLNADGSLDKSFSHYIRGNVMNLAVDYQDNVLVTGNYIDLKENGLIRFTADGILDLSFDVGTKLKASGSVGTYFAHVLPDERIAIGGLFDSYDGHPSPGFVVVDKFGAYVPVEIPYDSGSFPLLSVYGNNTLYMAGKFIHDHGKIIKGAEKIIFPLTGTFDSLHAEATTSSTITLSWNNELLGSEQIIIERVLPGQTAYETIDSVSIGVESYEVTGLNELSRYGFRIKAINELFATPYLESSDTTLISPELALPASDIAFDSFVANWEYLAGTDSTMLQVSSDDFSSFLPGYEGLILQDGSRLVSGTEPGVAYKYRVKRFKNDHASDFSEVIEVGVTTGRESPSSLEVNVYPNPATTSLTVETPDERLTTFALYSNQGKLLGVYQSGATKYHQINLSSIPKGVFVLGISTNGKTLHVKVVKE